MRLISVAAAALVMLLAAGAAAQVEATAVGTFDRPTIVVAFYRSPLWAELVKGKMAELQEAKAAGDPKKVEEVQRWGKGQQERAHEQLAGSAGIEDILEAMKPGLAEVGRAAGVSRIVAAPGPGRRTVDVSDRLLDWLKADERTRAIVKGLRK